MYSLGKVSSKELKILQILKIVSDTIELFKLLHERKLQCI